MIEYIISHKQIQELIERSVLEAIDGYRMGVAKQIWSFPKLPEIVRCRDCKHYCEAENYHPNSNYVMRCCKYFDAYNDEVEPDGFCAWGERRGDAQ